MFILHKNIDCEAEITIQVAHANPQYRLSCIKTHSPRAEQSVSGGSVSSNTTM